MIKPGSRRGGATAAVGGALIVAALLAAVAVLAAGGSAASSAAPANTSLPTITGQPVPGQTLEASPGTWSGTTPISFAYQWQRCPAGGACANISGATSQSYALGSADVGDTVRVMVTASNSGGSGKAASAPTATVAAPAQAPKNAVPPSIKGTLTIGQTLTAVNGTFTGTTPLTYGYQWLRCDQSGNTCASISGATASTYKLTTADAGHRFRVIVVAKNSAGSLNVTSSPSGLVGGTVNGCPVGAKGTVSAANIAAPARLDVDQLQFTPSVVTRAVTEVVARFHVSACSASVQGAMVYTTAVPYNQFDVPAEVATNSSGWATITLHRTNGFPAARRQQLLAMFVRARKPGGSLLGGVSTRRLVSTRVDLAR
jgi:hypothetical protein